MKQGALVLGIDDGPFRFDFERCALAGVVMRLDGLVVRLMSASIAVDGDDAEDSIVRLVRESRSGTLAAVMLDGVSFGGMNLVRPAAIHELTGVPVIAVASGEPDVESMRRVVAEKLDGDERKLAILDSLHPVGLGDSGAYANLAGIGGAEAFALVRANTRTGNTPECLRLAHMLATELGTVKSG